MSSIVANAAQAYHKLTKAKFGLCETTKIALLELAIRNPDDFVCLFGVDTPTREWQRLAVEGQRIAAIKEYRREAGEREPTYDNTCHWKVGLKEAKDEVEAYLEGRPYHQPEWYA